MSSQVVVPVGTPEVSAPRGLNQVERVVDTFVAPSKTFADILRSASWWLPCLLLVVSSLVQGFVIDRQVGFDRVVQTQMSLSPKAEDRMNQLDPAVKAKAVAQQTAGTKYATYASFVFVLIFVAIYSLILWASFNFGLGAQTKYGQVFAVTMYSALPYLVTVAIMVVMLYAGANTESFDLKNPVGTNPAYYMPDASPMVRAALSSLDLVKIWADVLQVIGMAIIARKTIMQSAMIVGGFWLLGVIVQVAVASFS